MVYGTKKNAKLIVALQIFTYFIAMNLFGRLLHYLYPKVDLFVVDEVEPQYYKNKIASFNKPKTQPVKPKVYYFH